MKKLIICVFFCVISAVSVSYSLAGTEFRQAVAASFGATVDGILHTLSVEQIISTAPDGTHYFDVTNAVPITETPTDEKVANYNSVFWVANGTNWTSEYLVKSTKIPQHFGYAISDETTDLTTGTAKVTDRMPCAFTVTGVRGVLSTVATGATLATIDVNDSGTTILSTKLTFDASESTTTTAATPAVISDTAIANNAVITIDIDAVGNTTTGKGAKVWLDGYCSE